MQTLKERINSEMVLDKMSIARLQVLALLNVCEHGTVRMDYKCYFCDMEIKEAQRSRK